MGPHFMKFVIVLSACAITWPSFARAALDPPVEFDKGLIPILDRALPILSLGSPASIPQDLLKEFVTLNAPNATLVTDPKTNAQFAYDGDRLVAFVDPTNGETRVFPNIGTFPPAEGPIRTDLAHKYVRDKLAFPKDHTDVSVINGSNLVGSTFVRDQNASEPQLYLSHAFVQRTIASGDRRFPVCGPGSRASFGFAADGNVRSVSYLWQSATLTGNMVKPNETQVVYESIIKQLGVVARRSPVKVVKVDVCFYDSASKFIQPVYRFEARTNNEASTNGTVAETRILGYLPIGRNSPELVPGLNAPSKGAPQPVEPTSLRRERRQAGRDIRVGRYVNRDDTHLWVDNANNFLPSLQNPFIFFRPIANFINSQYYWAYPYLFTGSKNSFVNSVHIAETEDHGNWHFFTTKGNCCDGVHLTDIPESGYGGGAGGSLAYWILHSCKVIPTPTDFKPAERHRAFAPWWRIFNGLHAAIGYRTIMYINDGVIPKFGRFIALGAPVVPTWLQVVHDDPWYQSGTLGSDGQPVGRASAVTVCGHERDTVLQLGNLGRPGCLQEFWYNN
jgi:hypothetical protein